jgi:hypothetical protein
LLERFAQVSWQYCGEVATPSDKGQNRTVL